jgi:hypothetical protein
VIGLFNSILIIFPVFLATCYGYFLIVTSLLERVENKKLKRTIKAMPIVIAYIFILLIVCLLATEEMGSGNSGSTTVLFAFYVFIYTLLFVIKYGFPITLYEPTESVLWTYILIGLLVYFIIIFISHYYLFQLDNRKKLVNRILITNILIIVSYLFFESTILGFATV